MDSRKYIGMDVHQASISIAVRDTAGKLVMESLIETKAATILEFFQGLKGTLCVAFEEGTSAAWLYDLIKPHVANVIVCDPRKNALLICVQSIPVMRYKPVRKLNPGAFLLFFLPLGLLPIGCVLRSTLDPNESRCLRS